MANVPYSTIRNPDSIFGLFQSVYAINLINDLSNTPKYYVFFFYTGKIVKSGESIATHVGKKESWGQTL